MYKPISKANIRLKTEEVNTIKPSPSPTPAQNIPRINTSTLLAAKVGEKYQAEIFTGLVGSHGDLKVAVEGLPEGLILGSCSQEYDNKLVPTPNTQGKCLIEGVPVKEGVYPIKISVTNDNSYGSNTSLSTLYLLVK